jgi:hypothetical protein
MANLLERAHALTIEQVVEEFRRVVGGRPLGQHRGEAGEEWFVVAAREHCPVVMMAHLRYLLEDVFSGDEECLEWYVNGWREEKA